MTEFLPDREKRHLLQFHVAKSMDYPKRLAVAVGLIATGVLMQVALMGEDLTLALVLGGAAVLLGNAFLLVKGFDLGPEKRLAGKEWERTTLDRFREIGQLETKMRRWDETAVDITCVTGFFALLAVLAPIALVYYVLAEGMSEEDWGGVFLVTALALILPHWVTGLRRKWRPVALSERIKSLEVALDVVSRYKGPPSQIQPRFHMSGEDEEKVPIDARIFIRFPDGPEEFLGVQFQVAINNVQGTQYPYLYAVLVAKKGFGLVAKHMEEIREQVSETITVEDSVEDDVEVIVIRQFTTEKSGYHTAPAMIQQIARLAWSSAARAIGSPVAAA